MKFGRLTASIFGVLCLGSVPSGSASDQTPVFETQIQPIFAHKCGRCHTDNVRKGGLDLSTIAGVRSGGESGEATVAESVDESLLWIMIDGGDMPPEGETALTEKERELIRLWLATGAKSEQPITPKEITQHDVLPIVLLRCVTCHGARLQESGLDLRTPTAIRRGGESGPAIVAGDADASLLIQRIESRACPPRELLLKFFVKRPPASEVKTLRDWINDGAREIDSQPDVATTEPDPLVTSEDRQHWAFRPLVSVGRGASIDEFLLKKMEAKGLTYSPEADRNTLIRRAYVDLIGMPPGVDEWRRWQSSQSPNWYRTMIDHLLESPHYGERWGRYWLDLAGYADSEGGVSADPIREVAWKYRDYVIRAFNADTPYDRFLLEQIAGDELLDVQTAPVVTAEMVDNLVATGFLRMGIDQTGSRTMNFTPERLGVIGDAITVVGEGVMGLTLGCAKCHSHKYDPIPHRDYYRFKAIFQGAFDEHDWLTFKNRMLQIDVPQRRQRVAKVNPPLAARLKKINSMLKKASATVQLELLRQYYPDQSEADRRETLVALRIPDNNRTQTQRILVEKLQRAEAISDADELPPLAAARRAVKDIEREMRDVRRQMEPPLAIRALWDRGEPSPTYILRRGEHDKPGRLVGPGVPSVLTDGQTPFTVEPPFPNGTPKTGRRLAFARWLTRPDHPLTARVMVNRIWYHHFGTGLVESLGNFGRKGGRPSHPELLDWLAVRFVEQGWSIKEMHRQIMGSQAYRQSSRAGGERQRIDPQNRLLSRMTMRRMDAEALRDSLLFVSGLLDPTPGGPPDSITVERDGLVSANPTPDGRWRRSIYLRYRRTEIPTIMDTFDYPEMGPNCLSRNVSIVSPQSLMLMNNRRTRDLAAAFATRVKTLHTGTDLGRQVDAVYQLALIRPPNAAERRLGVSALRELEAEWTGKPEKALETYCHVIFNSAAFMYVD